MKDILFKSPDPSYCFNASEPVNFYTDNTYDEHQFVRGELCSFDHEWETDIDFLRIDYGKQIS